jgi:hypothetical protein
MDVLSICWCGLVWFFNKRIVFLVREDCLSIVKIGQVENFVSLLCLSSLIEIDRL